MTFKTIKVFIIDTFTELSHNIKPRYISFITRQGSVEKRAKWKEQQQGTYVIKNILCSFLSYRGRLDVCTPIYAQIYLLWWQILNASRNHKFLVTKKEKQTFERTEEEFAIRKQKGKKIRIFFSLRSLNRFTEEKYNKSHPCNPLAFEIIKHMLRWSWKKKIIREFHFFKTFMLLQK